MFKGVTLILVTKQKTISLLRAKPTVTKGIHVAIKIRYSEPKLNQHSGKESQWIHSVNRVPRTF
jgi:hypothetical protein